MSKLLNQITFLKLKLNKLLFTISFNWLMFHHYINLLLTGAVQLHVLNNTSFLMAPVLRMCSVRRVSGLPPDQTGPQYLTANVSLLYLTLLCYVIHSQIFLFVMIKITTCCGGFTIKFKWQDQLRDVNRKCNKTKILRSEQQLFIVCCAPYNKWHIQGVQLKQATIVILETIEFKEKFKGGTFSYFSFIFN